MYHQIKCLSFSDYLCLKNSNHHTPPYDKKVDTYSPQKSYEK